MIFNDALLATAVCLQLKTVKHREKGKKKMRSTKGEFNAKGTTTRVIKLERE